MSVSNVHMENSEFLHRSSLKQLFTMQNVFGTPHTWIVGLRYASFRHFKCFCLAVLLTVGQLSWKLGTEKEKAHQRNYILSFFWVFVEVAIII